MVRKLKITENPGDPGNPGQTGGLLRDPQGALSEGLLLNNADLTGRAV